MKLAIWKTGHVIADTVADALKEGLNGELKQTNNGYQEADAHIGYGILRGSDEIFREADRRNKAWFNVDRGYFAPSHYEGYYRISYKGTQAKWHHDVPKQDFEGRILDWDPFDSKKYLMICPPTLEVCNFFGIERHNWLARITTEAHLYTKALLGECRYFVREKDSHQSLEECLDHSFMVVTFNSSVGWQALQKGIPCISDPNHSIVGSYYKAKGIDFLSPNVMDEIRQIDRRPLLESMRAHQFTLQEIREGKCRNLINHYLNHSRKGSIAGTGQ